MPRPKDKPPTEGGRMAENGKELAAILIEVPEANLAEKLAKISTYFIKKISQKDVEVYELKQEIEKLSNK
jgi:hypothetical protein